jgi:hypothetical protein
MPVMAASPLAAPRGTAISLARRHEPPTVRASAMADRRPAVST